MKVYFDYQATTPMDKRVLDEMMLSMTTEFGNASSKSHMFGWEAEKMVEKARKQVASVIGAESQDIIFTSGATESNNLAIKGVARFNKTNKKNHIITTQIEHKCVLESCRYLNIKEGFDIFGFRYGCKQRDRCCARLEGYRQNMSRKRCLFSYRLCSGIW